MKDPSIVFAVLVFSVEASYSSTERLGSYRFLPYSSLSGASPQYLKGSYWRSRVFIFLGAIIIASALVIFRSLSLRSSESRRVEGLV